MLGFLRRFVDSNDRELRRIQPLADRINELEPEMLARSDEEIRAFIGAVEGHGVDKGYFLTSGSFTRSAQDFAGRFSGRRSAA